MSEDMAEVRIAYLAVPVVEITDENTEVVCRWSKRDCNDVTIENPDASVASGESLQKQGGVIEETADLVLGLKRVRPVLVRKNGTICALHSVLP
jgi:hypothetical protein